MEHKQAYLVVICCMLIHMTAIGSDILFFHASYVDGTLAILAAQAVAYLLYPLLGWLADVYFARYKFILASFITMIVAVVVLLIMGPLLIMYSPDIRVMYFPLGVSIIITLLGLGMFESTAIQFGMDQLLEASSNQLSTFIDWYYWSCKVGQLIVMLLSVGVLIYFSSCTYPLNTTASNTLYNDMIQMYSFIIACMCTVMLLMAGVQLVCASVGLFLLVCSKRQFNIDRIGENPLTLIYRVLKYTLKHTCPENRSAFTYWEEDIPPRIDLGKSKYGGPFTTEEVEDTKTFFRIIILLLSLLGYHLSGHGFSIVDQVMRKQCPSHFLMLFLVDPMNYTYLTVILGIPLYHLIRRCCHRYRINMLKQMGLGLLCCLIKELLGIGIQASLGNEGNCTQFDSNPIDNCYLVMSEFNINGTCNTIANITKNLVHCPINNTPFLLLLIPNTLQGLSFLLVFMTALKFICAQAPLRLKGLLIGIWYALLATNYIAVEVIEVFTTSRTTWMIFHSLKTLLVLVSLLIYICVSKRYSYRLRDEVVLERFLAEQKYERVLNTEKECEDESGDKSIVLVKVNQVDLAFYRSITN